jgi:hypothetical protein
MSSKIAVLTALACAAVSTIAFADSVALPVAAYVPAPLTKVEVSPLCPEGVACLTNGTVVVLTFLIPCVGDLVDPIFSRLVRKADGGGTLYVQGTGLQTSESLHTFCFAPSYKTTTQTFVNTFLSESDVVDLGKR